MEIVKNESEKFEELKKKAKDKTNWRNRLEAVIELKDYDCKESIYIVTNLALHDRVFKVKEEAFRVAQSLNVTKRGNPIHLGRKDIGYKNKDFVKVFEKIKRECNMDEFDLDIFKEKFKVVNPEMYDVMKFEKCDQFEECDIDKSEQFDKWIENMFKSLPKK
ncbi:Uncharacterised protein [Clostridioides difficile]|uniref:hypothetical protein n=1 Tax=Clostridioides difficile TaxID=1496 RepID=UPI0003B29A78|nr:hypothetical protein [Clostridioides difficile]MCE0686080.1 HEAT repeat domain-containing protein [Clostridioides difficile]MCE0712556.1 HEAT repeat domain-containing protein [Clostridioides difficile]MCE0719977.1 HEAT repeat domain-containing protein [Clostridioides difficile]MCE0729248.1 HEAT repeat domain-containing protein [Clostridioides difficile]QPL01286.1 hypothetical protein CDIF101085_03080 [Clostridioides difficile]